MGEIIVPAHQKIIERFGYNTKELAYKYILVQQFEQWLSREKTLLLINGVESQKIKQGGLSVSEMEALSKKLDKKFELLRLKKINNILYYKTNIFIQLYALRPKTFYKGSNNGYPN